MLRILITAIVFVSVSSVARAQWNPAPSYADLYNQQLAQSGQALNSRSYLWDRYYYNNPNVSPYLNLLRARPYGGTTYSTYVQPQEQQRQAAARMTFGGPDAGGRYSAGATAPRNPFSPNGTSRESTSTGNGSFYYSHYYGDR